MPLSQEAATLLKDLTKGKAAEEPVFERYAKDRGMDNCSQMLMKDRKSTRLNSSHP